MIRGTRSRRTAVRAALVIGLIGIGATGAVAASAAPSTASKPCLKGSVAAQIAGKQACLKTGQTCTRSLDRQYHRYRFHCHIGRLTRTARQNDAFSRKVDVGAFRLAISCRGKGSPTVVLESGPGSSSASWLGIRPTLARTTRVCSYDRAGLGNSEARVPPGPVQAAKVVMELHTLLRGAGIRPPYVLGGWDIGGFFNRLYAKRYPVEVVGLVSVDGTPIGLPGEPFLNWTTRLGYPPQAVIGTPSDSYYPGRAGAELGKRPNLRARPFVVLTPARLDRSPDDLPPLLEWQKQLARLSGSSMLVRADIAGSGAIHWQAPALTAEAFRLVIVAARRGARLPPCAATRLPKNLYGTCLDPTRP
jgi:pimeloyl-ACP methyl ester carboxylesterase